MSNNANTLMAFALAFPVNIRSLPPKGVDLTLKTDEKERQALAKNHNLLDVTFFEATIHINPWKRQGVKLSGKLHAKIIQECIISAQPVDSIIEEDIELILVPEGSRLSEIVQNNAHELFLDPDGPDVPDSFKGTEIDVGAIVEEFFELAIDSYPRASGVEFEGVEFAKADVGNEKKPSPFAVLSGLKQK